MKPIVLAVCFNQIETKKVIEVVSKAIDPRFGTNSKNNTFDNDIIYLRDLYKNNGNIFMHMLKKITSDKDAKSCHLRIHGISESRNSPIIYMMCTFVGLVDEKIFNLYLDQILKSTGYSLYAMLSCDTDQTFIILTESNGQQTTKTKISKTEIDKLKKLHRSVRNFNMNIDRKTPSFQERIRREIIDIWDIEWLDD